MSWLKQYGDYYFVVPKGTGRIIPLLIIEAFAMSISFFISIYFSHSLHFNSFDIGKLIAATSLGTCLGALISGYLTTKIPTVKIASFGFLLFSLVFLLLTVVKSPLYLLGVMFLGGVSGVLMMIANMTALVRLATDDAMKNRLIVIQSVIFNAAVSVSGLLLTILNKSSIVNLFMLLSITLFCAGIYFYNTKSSNENHVKNKSKKLNFKRVNIPMFTMIIPCIICYGVIFAIVKTYFPVEVTDKYSSSWLSWLVLSINPFMMVFVQPLLIGSLRDLSNITLIAIGGLLLGIGYTFFSISVYVMPTVFFIIVASLGEMLFSPVSKSVASSALGKGNEGMGLAFWKMTYNLSGIIGAGFSGYIGLNYGKQSAWLLCIPLAAGIILSCVMYRVSLLTKKMA